MAAHWVSVKYTGFDDEGRPGIVYEGGDLVGGMRYFGILGDYLTGIKGTAISAESPTGSIMLPPEYAGKTISLNLCGGALVPNVVADTISVYAGEKEPTPGVPGTLLYVTKVCLIHSGTTHKITLYYWLDGKRFRAGSAGSPVPYTSPSCNLNPKIYDNTDAIEIATDFGSVRTTGPYGTQDDPLYLTIIDGVWVGECSQEIIIRFTDDPTKVADCFYTIKGGTPNIPAKSATPFTIQCPANQTVRINVGVTEDTIDSFTDFYACTGKVLEVPLQVGVAPPPGEAYLTLTVVDHEDAPIEGATVTVDGATGTTDVDGWYTTSLKIGEEFTATVTKDGYEPGTLTDTMLEEGLPIKIMLVKIGELITQLIIVKKAGADFQEEYITGATVTVDGKSCEGLPDGLYSIEIEEGIEATAEVKAEGYKDKTETFTTTSMATLTIELEPAVPEGESEQIFTLKDAEGNPIEGATITVGEESCVTDSEGKCVITAPIGEATTATITKPGYEDAEMTITPGEDGNEYSVTLPRAEEILTLPPGVKDDLNAGTVSDEIKDAFAAAGIPLSDEATIEKIDEDTWKVTDGEDVYSVLEEEGELNVYPGGGAPAPPEPPTPPPGEMLQLIIVHEEGIFPFKYIIGATVTVDGVACTDEGEGHYSINLTIGATVTATIEKEGYETVEHTFTVTEGRTPVIPLPITLSPDRFEITVTNLDVVADIKKFAVGCFTPSPLPVDWFNMIGGKQVAYKKLSRYDPTETVIFQESDGLIVGQPYVFRQGREFFAPIIGDFFINLGAGMIGLGEGAELRGVQQITVDARSIELLTLPHPLKWVCDMLGVADCTAFVAESGFELIFAQHAWKCILEGTDIYGNPCTPTKLDWFFVCLDMVGLIPFGMLKAFGSGGKIVAVAATKKLVKPWLETAAGAKRVLRVQAGGDKDAVFEILKFIHNDDVAGLTKFCDARIARDKPQNIARKIASGAEQKIANMEGRGLWDFDTADKALRDGHLMEAFRDTMNEALKGLPESDVVKVLDDVMRRYFNRHIAADLTGYPDEFVDVFRLNIFKNYKHMDEIRGTKYFDDFKNFVYTDPAAAEKLKASAKYFTDDELTTIYFNLENRGEGKLVLKIKSLLGEVVDWLADALKAMNSAADAGDWSKVEMEWLKAVDHDIAKIRELGLADLNVGSRISHEFMVITEWAKISDLGTDYLKTVAKSLDEMADLEGDTVKAVLKSFDAGELTKIYKTLDDNGYGALSTKLQKLLGVVFDFAAVQEKIMAKVNADDWIGALKEWDLGVAGDPHNVYRLEARLTEMTPPVQRIHNIMRYTDLEYIKAIDEAPGQLQKGFTFLVNHLTTAGEPTSYLDVIKALSPEQYSAVIRNLDTVDAHGVAKLVEGLDVTVDAAKLTGTVDGAKKVAKTVEDTVRTGAATGASAFQKSTMKAAQRIISESWQNISPSLKDGNYLKDFMSKLDDITDPKSQKYAARMKQLVVDIVEKSSGQKWAEMDWITRAWHYFKSIGIFCFLMFIAEEALQLTVFSAFPVVQEMNNWARKSASEKEACLNNYQTVVNFQKAMWMFVSIAELPALLVCLPLAPLYVAFNGAAAFNINQHQWRIDTKREDGSLLDGFNVYIPIRSNVNNVELMIGATLQMQKCNTYSRNFKVIFTEEESQTYQIIAKKQGYMMSEPIYVTATAADIGPDSVLGDVLIDMIPEATVAGGKPLAGIPYPTPTDIDWHSIPVSWGGLMPDAEWEGGYGDIDCRTTGGGAEIWLTHAATGVRKYAGKTNDVIRSIPVGDYIVEFIKDGYRCTDCPGCSVPVSVRVGPAVNAWCTMAEITAFEPVAKLIVKPSTYANTGEELSFGAEGSEPGTGASFASFTFDFGDGTPSATITSLAIPEPQKHTYAEPGDYTAKLTITNSEGLIGEDFVYVTISGAEGTINFYRESKDKLISDTPEIWFKKEGSELWEVSPQSGPSGSYHDIVKWPVGRYEIEYRYLDITRCGKPVEVKADVETAFSCALSLYLPDQTVVPGVNNVKTTVTGIIDGDTIRTAFTDGLPHSAYYGFQSVRMVGYDSPDLTIVDKYATEKLETLIPNGTPITLKIVSYNVLGKTGRVLAAVIRNSDGMDINRAMIESCLVSAPEYKNYEKDLPFNWIMEFSKYWCDPESDKALGTIDPNTGKTYISMIVDTAAKTVQINNRWLPVYAVVRKFKGAVKTGTITEYAAKTIATDATSSAYGYADTEVLKLYVSSKEIDDKNTGFEIESILIGEAPPDTYPVTFTSSPAGANVIVTPGTISISRLTSVLRSQRDSTPISRFAKRQRFK